MLAQYTYTRSHYFGYCHFSAKHSFFVFLVLFILHLKFTQLFRLVLGLFLQELLAKLTKLLDVAKLLGQQAKIGLRKL